MVGRRLRVLVLHSSRQSVEEFERKVIALGGHVHWAPTAADARRIIADLCRSVGARTVAKSKSMVAEEIALNEHLEELGIAPIETDLGEYIIQLRHEPPSHIIAPAVHLTKDQVARLDKASLTTPPYPYWHQLDFAERNPFPVDRG